MAVIPSNNPLGRGYSGEVVDAIVPASLDPHFKPFKIVPMDYLSDDPEGLRGRVWMSEWIPDAAERLILQNGGRLRIEVLGKGAPPLSPRAVVSMRQTQIAEDLPELLIGKVAKGIFDNLTKSLGRTELWESLSKTVREGFYIQAAHAIPAVLDALKVED